MRQNKSNEFGFDALEYLKLAYYLIFFPNLPTHNRDKRNSLVRTGSFRSSYLLLDFYPAFASCSWVMHNLKGNIVMELKLAF